MSGSRPKADHAAFAEAEESVVGSTRRLLSARGKRTVQSFHKELGRIMWEYCGMGRTDEGLTKARKLVADVRALAEDIGSGDVTTDSIVPEQATMSGQIIANKLDFISDFFS